MPPRYCKKNSIESVMCVHAFLTELLHSPQAGAALQTGSHDDGARVPAGLQAFKVSSSLHSGTLTSWRAGAKFDGLYNSGDLECSYGIMPSHCWNVTTHISKMLFKPIVRRSIIPKSIGHTFQLAYCVSWRVSAPVRDDSNRSHSHVVGRNIQLCAQNGTNFRLHSNSGDACSVTSGTALGLLQVLGSQRTHSSLCLHTFLCEPYLHHDPAHAAIAGIFKVVAREDIGQIYTHFAHSLLGTQIASSFAGGSDMFGQKLAGELVKQPNQSQPHVST